MQHSGAWELRDPADKMGHFKCLTNVTAIFPPRTTARLLETWSSLSFDTLDLKENEI